MARLSCSVSGRHVILVDDMIDTGHTINIALKVNPLKLNYFTTDIFLVPAMFSCTFDRFLYYLDYTTGWSHLCYDSGFAWSVLERCPEDS